MGVKGEVWGIFPGYADKIIEWCLYFQSKKSPTNPLNGPLNLSIYCNSSSTLPRGPLVRSHSIFWWIQNQSKMTKITSCTGTMCFVPCVDSFGSQTPNWTPKPWVAWSFRPQKNKPLVGSYGCRCLNSKVQFIPSLKTRGCSSHDIENIPTTNKKLPTTRKALPTT